MSKYKKIIGLMFGLLLLAQLASAVELKAVKVEDLKIGDVIVDKNGNEITVTEIATQPSESLTISEYLSQKLNGDSLKRERSPAQQKFVGDGNNGGGAITGNAIVSGTNEQADLNNFQKIVNKIKAWWSSW